ncbi:MAG: HEAT repeat domain-containing protein [Cyanobacteria bacterium K_DeepCast_35m_m2_023]|nr:HEAT repeat domain-containing protein [Cyanobacteria bacterium K_DeepCast_35m_m2_023]
MPDQPLDDQQLAQLREAIASGDPGRAMPALAGLREVAPDQAIPLLLLGLEQEVFMVRSLSCAGLGYKQSPEGWTALERALVHDEDPNVRAEAANALVSYSLERAWPLLIEAFTVNDHWLVRCSILSAVAELTEAPSDWLLQLARLAIADGDGTVRVGGAEILGRLVSEAGAPAELSAAARAALVPLQSDSDHRVVAAALNGLQG